MLRGFEAHPRLVSTRNEYFFQKERMNDRELNSTVALENRRPLTDGVAGYRVVRLLEAAQQSLQQNGREMQLGPSAIRSTEHAAVASH